MKNQGQTLKVKVLAARDAFDKHVANTIHMTRETSTKYRIIQNALHYLQQPDAISLLSKALGQSPKTPPTPSKRV